MATYTPSNELAELGDRVIHMYADEFEDIINYACKIGYQYSDSPKKSNGKIVYADTTKVADKVKGFANLDFIITFYEPNTEELEEEIQERLMYHELLHIGFKEGLATIIPHDLEDFRKVIERWGVDWIANEDENAED